MDSLVPTTLLVTGFEPFREHVTNSSWDALSWLAPRWPSDIVARRLPVDHRLAHALLRQWLDELSPRAVLCTGLAKGRVFRIERRARRPPELHDVTGDDELRGRWPWQEMESALEEAGASIVHSEDCGRYVCESTYWSLLTYAPGPELAAFLHVPPESEEHDIARIGEAVGRVIDSCHRGLLSRTVESGRAGAPAVSPAHDER